MKILQVIQNLDSLGGSQVACCNISRELLKNKHDVKIVSSCRNIRKGRGELFKGSHDGIDVYYINNRYGRFIPVNSDKKIVKSFRKVLQSYKPDLVHVHHVAGLSLHIIGEISKFKIPVVLTLHDYWPICPTNHMLNENNQVCDGITAVNYRCSVCGKTKTAEQVNNISGISLNISMRLLGLYYKLLNIDRNYFIQRQKLVKESLEKVSTILCPSYALMNKIKDNFNLLNVKYLPNGIDIKALERYKNSSIESKHTTQKLDIIYLGGFSKIKGVEVLIKAFNILNEYDINLKIYGLDAGDKYQQFIRALSINKKVKFCKRINHEEIGKVISSCDVLVIPSICLENSPLVIQEAFYFNKPVIVSDIGGLPELVTNGGGVTFKNNDPEDLALKIKHIYNNRNCIDKMKERIPRIINLENHTNDILGIYKEVIADYIID